MHSYGINKKEVILIKYRIDFVTNSSSSSFIFGLPNGSTFTIDFARNFIKNSAKLLLSIINYLDNEAYRISGVGALLKRFRKSNNKNDYELELLVHKLLYNSRIFKYKVKSIFKKYGIEITNDGNIRGDSREGNHIPYYYFLCCYLDKYDIVWLKNIAKGNYDLKFEFVDFRNTEQLKDNWEVKGIVDYFIDGTICKKLGDLTCAEITYQQLGEVALLGDDPCLPMLLTWYLYCKLDYACMHMG